MNFEADVVPCFQYRRYKSFGISERDKIFDEGIPFFTYRERKQIVNYPKLHIVNGQAKNQTVNEMYKPTVRIFKNLKARLIDMRELNTGIASSYFVENLLYNVPNHLFVRNNFNQTVFNILSWLHTNEAGFSTFVCQNHQTYLFGSSQEQWNLDDCRYFLTKCINLWNEW